jgi:hypothetical protein
MLPNKLTDYFDKPAWINRILFYTTIFASIALAFIIVFGIFNLIFPNFTFPNDAIDYDNERYLLSALVQSLAATIALVITLSLVAVQLAAQSYSARVIDVYKRNPDMWILLCIYIFTIFYGLGLTKIVGLGILGNYMEGAIFVAYFMGFFAFVCLVPYMLKTLDLLKPSTVITLLAEEITLEKVLMAADYEDESIYERDPVQPIFDIINSALARNDYETVRNGLSSIQKSTTDIIEKIELNNEEEIFAEHMMERIKWLGIQAANKNNEDSTLWAVINLGKIGLRSAEEKHEIATQIAVNKIESLATEVINQNLVESAELSIQILVSISIISTENKLKNTSRNAVRTLGIVGKRLVHNNIEKPGSLAAMGLGKIIVKAITNELEITAISASLELGSIAKKAAEEKRELITVTAIDTLENLGNDDSYQDIELIVEYLGDIGLKSAQNELILASGRAVDKLANLTTRAAEENLEKATKIIAESLRDIGNIATQKGLEYASIKSENELKLLIGKAKRNNWNEIIEIINEAIQSIEQTKKNN